MGTLGKKILMLDVRRAQKGDSNAFVKIIEENKNSMYRVANGILDKEEDIEDAISEAILKAYKGIRGLRELSLFKTWLIRIVINESNNIYVKRKNEIIVDKVNEGQVFDYYKDFTLYDAINSLDNELRLTTLLFYFEDMKYREIADLLHIKEGTVKSRLSRAKEKLYNLLKEDYYG